MSETDGLTMMIVTHEMKFARDVATRVFYMDQGEIYEQARRSRFLITRSANERAGLSRN